MNNTYRPPGGRPPVGINTPMAPTPPNPLNRANQLMANDRAQNAVFKSGAYAGLPAITPDTKGAPTAEQRQQLNASLPVSAAPKTSDEHMQAAQRAAQRADLLKQTAMQAGVDYNPGARPLPMPPTGGGVGANPFPMPPTGPIGGGIGANPPPTPAPAPGRAGIGPDPAMSTVFRKGGNVKAYAKGGKVSSASSRGDGIASRGKTRGKMC